MSYFLQTGSHRKTYMSEPMIESYRAKHATYALKFCNTELSYVRHVTCVLMRAVYFRHRCNTCELLNVQHKQQVQHV